MFVPRGEWFNHWTDQLVSGGKEMWVDADIETIPIFIKAGAVIPKYPVQQYVGEIDIEEVTLDIYFKNGKEVSTLYDDAHDGYDYTKGRYSLRTFKLTGKSEELIIQQHKEGKYDAGYQTFKIKFHGLPFTVSRIQVDNEEIALSDVKMNGNNTMIIDKGFSELHLFGK